MALLALPTAGNTVSKRLRLSSRYTGMPSFMPNQLKHLVCREHLRLEVEILLELVVVYPCVAGCEDKHTALVGLEGQRLCDAGALDAQSLSRQLNGCGGNGEFLNSVLQSESSEICAAFFD